MRRKQNKKFGEKMSHFRSVYESAHDEVYIEKSRFIGYCTPIESETDALAFIEQIKKKHWDATHNVPVYVIGSHYEIQRYSDDGEPSGTAGVPILSMLKAEGITNVCVVVTRYFGGVKLGTGGLVRAYTQTAKIGLEAGRIIDKIKNDYWTIQIDYTQHGKVQNYLMGEEKLILEDTEFTDAVTLYVFSSNEDTIELQGKITNLTNAQARYALIGEAYLSVSHGEILEKTII